MNLGSGRRISPVRVLVKSYTFSRFRGDIAKKLFGLEHHEQRGNVVGREAMYVLYSMDTG